MYEGEICKYIPVRMQEKMGGCLERLSSKKNPVDEKLMFQI